MHWLQPGEKCAAPDPGQAGRGMLAPDAVERAMKQTVDVEVKAIFPSSEKTYEVEWVETTRSLAGTVIGEPQRWKGSFTIVVNPPTDEALARMNPLGIYITSAAWSRVL